MKIGIICPSFPPSDAPDGIGDYTRILADALARRGSEVWVWTRPSHPGPEEIGRVKVVPFRDRWDLAALGGALRLARSQRLDVLNVQYAPDLFPAAAVLAALPLWLRVSASKAVFTTSFHTLGGRSLGSRLRSYLLIQGSRGVISTNEEVTHLLGKYAARALSKTREIPIGSNIQPATLDREAIRSRVRSRLNLDNGASLLAHFGQFYPGKGVETLLEAAALLSRSGLSFKILMIGGSKSEAEPYRRGLRACAERLGVAGYLIWTGARPEEEVAEFLAASDLYVVPYDGGASTRRGSLMAGLAAGMAVVTTHPEIPSAYFRDGENLALVPAGDPEALARLMRELLADDGRRRGLERGARELALRFDWDGIAEQTEDFFRELLSAEAR